MAALVSVLSHGFLLLSSVLWLLAVQSDGEDLLFDDYECPVKVKVNQSNHCECNSILEIRCQHLDYVPLFTSNDNIYNGIYMSRQSIPRLPAMIFQNLHVKKIVLDFNPIGNEISQNAFQFNVETLQELSLGACGISKLPVELLENMNSLKFLYLWRNKIRVIPANLFVRAPQLRELSLWGNGIEDINDKAFLGLWSLQKLDLDDNCISSLNRDAFRHLTSLRVLHLGENKIHTIYDDTFVYMGNLRTLSLDQNQLKFVYEKAFSGLSNLATLSLQRNIINYLPAVVFKENTKLQVLYLNDNNIDRLWPQTFIALQKLQLLDLSRNPLNEFHDAIFTPLHNLRQLYLDQAGLESLQWCAMYRKMNLETLSLLGNPFECTCDVSWVAGVAAKGTTVWGSCKTWPSTQEGLPSIASQEMYRGANCSMEKPDCVQRT